MIVGYDEPSSDVKTGSHNLVVGPEHTYSSYGGLVAGGNNKITGALSAVLSGQNNTASGMSSSVTARHTNTASGLASSVSGGYDNIAAGELSAVSGGYTRDAPGQYDWAGGGYFQADGAAAKGTSIRRRLVTEAISSPEFIE